jgi:hypothetical protein
MIWRKSEMMNMRVPAIVFLEEVDVVQSSG